MSDPGSEMQRPRTAPFAEAANVEAAADALFEARRTLRPIEPISTTHALTGWQEAYAVQERNTVRYLAQGRRLAGRKIGLTSAAVQAQLGVDQPDYGMLWSDLNFGEGEPVPVSRFMQPKIEAEIAFLIERDIEGETIASSDLVRSIGAVLPAAEIVDSAIAGWKIKLADTIADNASAGGFVLGTAARRLSDVDLRLAGMVMTLNGATVSLGVAAACLGNPLHAALWLARKMTEIGRPLKAGDIILSGALGPMTPLAAGDRFVIQIQGFSPLMISVEA